MKYISESEKPEPTWDDIGAIARAISVLMQADLSHDFLVEHVAPLAREISTMTERLVLDPHGDGL